MQNIAKDNICQGLSFPNFYKTQSLMDFKTFFIKLYKFETIIRIIEEITGSSLQTWKLRALFHA